MPGLTDSDIAAAYPYFYGQVVYARETPPTEPGGKSRLNVGFKPYAQFLDNEVSEITVGGDGLLKDTYFYTSDNLKQKLTGIHKFLMGLRAFKDSAGQPIKDTDQATGLEAWFKQEPPRGSFQGNILPSYTPRIGGQPVPAPARPDDWDLEQYLADHATDGDAPVAGAQVGSDTIPENLYDEVVSLLAGKNTSQMAKTLLSNDTIAAFGVPAMKATVDAIVGSGRLLIEAGRYVPAGGVLVAA